MDHCHSLAVLHHTDLQRISLRRWANEHRDCWVVSLECSPVVSNSMEHVIFVDAVLAGFGFDVQEARLRRVPPFVNMC